MFNFIKASISNLINVIKTPKQVQVAQVEVVAKDLKAPRKAKVLNEIDGLFLELSREMNIPFVKGPFAPVAKASKTERTPRIAQVKQTFVDNTGLIIPGKKGVSNTQMIPALIAQAGNEANIRILFNTYPEVFQSTVKYMPKTMKSQLVSIVNEKYPEFKI